MPGPLLCRTDLRHRSNGLPRLAETFANEPMFYSPLHRLSLLSPLIMSTDLVMSFFRIRHAAVEADGHWDALALFAKKEMADVEEMIQRLRTVSDDDSPWLQRDTLDECINLSRRIRESAMRLHDRALRMNFFTLLCPDGDIDPAHRLTLYNSWRSLDSLDIALQHQVSALAQLSCFAAVLREHECTHRYGSIPHPTHCTKALDKLLLCKIQNLKFRKQKREEALARVEQQVLDIILQLVLEWGRRTTA